MSVARIIIVFCLLSVQSSAVRAEGRGKAFLDKAMEYYERDEFPDAMRYFTKGMIAAEAEGDSHTQLVCTGYVSNVFFNVGDYERCVPFLTKGYEMTRRNGAASLADNFITNIVAAYCKMDDAQRASAWLCKLEETKDVRDSVNFRYFLIYDCARVAMAEHKASEALRLHREALSYARKMKMGKAYEVYQMCEIGEIYLKQGNAPEALKCGYECLSMMDGQRDRDVLVSVYQILDGAFRMNGDDRMSRKYQQMYLSLTDSLFDRNRIYAASNELIEYEARRTDQHIRSLNTAINRQMLAIVAFAVLTLALIILAAMLVRKNRRLRDTQRTLVDKNLDMEKQEKNSRRIIQQLVEADVATDVAQSSAGGAEMDKEQAGLLLNRVMKVMDDIDVISNPDFNLNMLADMVKSNTNYVSWVINNMFNKNFKTLLNECRIREASRRLLDSEHYGRLTIKAVYESVGYTNAVSFIRAFKKVNGMTPSEYVCAASDKATNKYSEI